jgi:squalene-hopene/tetraprenyl-beta-curcumene cyclase
VKRFKNLCWIGLLLYGCAAKEPAPVVEARVEEVTAAGQKTEAGPKSKPNAEWARIESMLQSGLAWLAQAQHEDGSWGGRPDVGITGLAVTALARGDRQRYSTAIDQGIAYLFKNRRADGAFVNPDGTVVNYRTAVAVQALLAVDPHGYAEAIRKGRDVILKGQVANRDDLINYGGFGYDPAQRKDADMNNTVFAMETMHQLEQHGYEVPLEAWQRAQTFLNRIQNRTESNDASVIINSHGNDGGFHYRVNETKANDGKPIEGKDGKKIYPSYGSMTYAGLLSFIYAKVDKEDPRVQAALQWIRDHYTLTENPGMTTRADPAKGKEGLYYYLHTFVKTLSTYGEETLQTPQGARPWRSDLISRLAELQQPDGRWENPEDRWWEADPSLVTSYICLALAQCKNDLKSR